jgi:hypothetical protein
MDGEDMLTMLRRGDAVLANRRDCLDGQSLQPACVLHATVGSDHFWLFFDGERAYLSTDLLLLPCYHRSCSRLPAADDRMMSACFACLLANCLP